MSSFKNIENKHDVYLSKSCTRKFWEYLIGHAIRDNDFKKNNIKLLTNE